MSFWFSDREAEGKATEHSLVHSLFVSTEEQHRFTASSPYLFSTYEIAETEDITTVDPSQLLTTNVDLAVYTTKERIDPQTNRPCLEDFSGKGVLHNRYAKELSHQAFQRTLAVFGYQWDADETKKPGLVEVASFIHLFRGLSLNSKESLHQFLIRFRMEELFSVRDNVSITDNLELFGLFIRSICQFRPQVVDGQHRAKLLYNVMNGIFHPETYAPLKKDASLSKILTLAGDLTVYSQGELADKWSRCELFKVQCIKFGEIMDPEATFAKKIAKMKQYGLNLTSSQALHKDTGFCDVVLAVLDAIESDAQLEPLTHANHWARYTKSPEQETDPKVTYENNIRKVWQAIKSVLEQNPAYTKFLSKDNNKKSFDWAKAEKLVTQKEHQFKASYGNAKNTVCLSELVKIVATYPNRIGIIRSVFRSLDPIHPQRDSNAAVRDNERFKRVEWWRTFIFPVHYSLSEHVLMRSFVEQKIIKIMRKEKNAVLKAKLSVPDSDPLQQLPGILDCTGIELMDVKLRQFLTDPKTKPKSIGGVETSFCTQRVVLSLSNELLDDILQGIRKYGLDPQFEDVSKARILTQVYLK